MGFVPLYFFACGEDGLLVTEVVNVDVLFFLTLSYSRASAFRFLEVPQCIFFLDMTSVVFMSNKTEFRKKANNVLELAE